MSAFESTLKYLYELQFFGMKLGLDNTVALLESMDNPHRKFPTIHVAGTNGKGSTCAMMASILEEAGFRTGLYTSPHIRHFSERIRINGQMIPEEEIVRLTERMRPRIDELKCTFFEATTVLAFQYFTESGVDLAIVETGLGGRLDATNVLQPLVSVITNIDLEHTEHLGATLEDIAMEKAGVIKKDAPCVIGPVDEVCCRVFDRIGLERQARVSYLDRTALIRNVSVSPDGSSFDLHILGDESSYEFGNMIVNLAGGHQVTNAGLAILALMRQNTFLIPEGAIRSGLQHVSWKGRLQWLEGNILVDAAHNPAGLRQLRRTLGDVYRPKFRRVVLIIGMLADKDYQRAMEDILPACDEVITVTPASPRALPAEILAGIAQNKGWNAEAAGSLSEAIAKAKKQTSRDDLIVITGSHFVLSEIDGL